MFVDAKPPLFTPLLSAWLPRLAIGFWAIGLDLNKAIKLGPLEGERELAVESPRMGFDVVKKELMRPDKLCPLELLRSLL